MHMDPSGQFPAGGYGLGKCHPGRIDVCPGAGTLREVWRRGIVKWIKVLTHTLHFVETAEPRKLAFGDGRHFLVLDKWVRSKTALLCVNLSLRRRRGSCKTVVCSSDPSRNCNRSESSGGSNCKRVSEQSVAGIQLSD